MLVDIHLPPTVGISQERPAADGDQQDEAGGQYGAPARVGRRRANALARVEEALLRVVVFVIIKRSGRRMFAPERGTVMTNPLISIPEILSTRCRLWADKLGAK